MDILEEQLKVKRAGIPHAVLTVAETEGTSPCIIGKKMLLLEDGATFGTVGGGELEYRALADAAQAIKERKSFYKWYEHTPQNEAPGLGCSYKVSLLVEVFGPSLQLVVCGAGHVGGVLLRLAKMLSFETILLDDRLPDQIMDKIELADHFIQCAVFEEGISTGNILDGAYYVCCASTHTQDKSALKGALQKKFSYIGMLGSMKKKKDMFKQLETEGFSTELLESVHTPAGLDICDMSPEEVAFSIMAEVLMIKNNGNEKSRRNRS